MKIFVSLAVLSMAIGAWLGSQVPADELPPETVVFEANPRNDVVVIRIAAKSRDGARTKDTAPARPPSG